MPTDLAPIFAINNEDGTTLKALPTVTVDGKEYLPSQFIRRIVETIAPEVKELAGGGRLGELTLAAYVLMESLTEADKTSVVEALFADPQALYQAAVFTAIGMQAGQSIPEGVIIGTENPEGATGLRELVSGAGPAGNDPIN